MSENWFPDDAAEEQAKREETTGGGVFLRFGPDSTTIIRPVSKFVAGWSGFVDGTGDEKNTPVECAYNANDNTEYKALKVQLSGNADSRDKDPKFTLVCLALAWAQNGSGGFEQLPGVKIVKITQKAIRQGLQELSKHPEWGDPSDFKKGYSITIKRVDPKGSRGFVKYNLSPNPVKELDMSLLPEDFDQYDVDKYWIGEAMPREDEDEDTKDEPYSSSPEQGEPSNPFNDDEEEDDIPY